MIEKAFLKLQAWLTDRRLAVHLAAIAVVLTLPALWAGWQLDDHFHRLVMLDKAPGIAPLQLFTVMTGDPEINRALADLGSFPWWTAENYRITFFRYLSLASMWIDYRLWPDSAALMHAHSLLWLAALVAAVTGLYRRLHGPTVVAGLAALLYAVDDAHAAPAAWLANRNALLATFFGVLCLIAHDRWRRDRRPGEALLGPLCLALGLAAGEMAVATAGYLVAYAVYLDRDSAARRIVSLVPSGAVLAGWALVYRVGGFGASGSGLYVDPAGNPVAFSGALAKNVPFLVLGQYSPMPADLGAFFEPSVAWGLWFFGVALILGLGVLLAPMIRRDPVARFWCTGMLLSLVPVSATFPSNRLLFFVGLGAMGLLGQFLVAVVSGAGPLPGEPTLRMLAKIAAALLILTHLVLSPLSMPAGAQSIRFLGEPLARAAASLPDDDRIAQQDLVIVNAPDYLSFVSYMSTIQLLEGRPIPKRIRCLSSGPTALEITRLDASTLRVRSVDGFFEGPLGRLFRDRANRLPPGTVVELTGVRITVVESTEDEAAPLLVDYRFAVPLEDATLRWVRWKDGEYSPFTPPEPGRTVELPAALGPFELLAR